VVPFIQPSLVVVQFGPNDYFNSGTHLQPRTVAQYQADLATIIAAVRAKCATSPTFVLMPAWQRGDMSPYTLPEPWANYVAANYAVAAADSIALVCDVNRRAAFTGPATTSNNNGIVSTDTVHPSDLGSQFIADALTASVLPR
jgi:lysophospholipase L1-like esterase